MIEWRIGANVPREGATSLWLPPTAASRPPEFATVRVPWGSQFASSIATILWGPAALKTFPGLTLFRDCWIEPPFPKVGFVTAIALQVMLLLFPPPIWKIRMAPREIPPSRTELTWYGPIKDFPMIVPKGSGPRTQPPDPAVELNAPRGADAFHPRQTIISAPLHPNHPHQTLIQPAAPPEPPKILPELPNIVRLAGAEPARPKLQLTPEQLAAMRPKALTARSTQAADAPEVAATEKQAGPITIASYMQAPQRPAMPVTPMSAPRAVQQRAETSAATPEVGQQGLGDNTTLIALSATPANVPAPPMAPAGNLSARLSMSPEGTQSGATRSGETGNGVDAGTGVAGGGNGVAPGGSGPEGIFITRGNPENEGPTSGMGIGSASRAPGSSASKPALRPNPRANDAKSSADPGADRSNSKLGVAPDEVLRAKRVYTMHVNMPNLTSASGSWVLNFAELDEGERGPMAQLGASELAGPVALRKVDPKYPPELRTAHVEGEVVLYAVIRKDGTVDSIQLVRGVDPFLDANAVDALAQWKFRPAEKRGEAVDLEAVVHIPFKSRAPVY